MSGPPPTAELRARRQAFAARLREGQLPLALLWQPATVCYFSGNEIPGPNAILLDAEAHGIVICDEYHEYNFRALQDDLEVRPYPYTGTYTAGLFEHAGETIDQSGWAEGPVGVELRDLRRAAWLALEQRLPRARLTAVDELVGSLRLVKSPLELTYVRQAAEAVRHAYAAAAEALKRATSERELAQIIYRELIGAGSEAVAGQPYVKSGPRALLTHAHWSDREIGRDDHVLLEIGASVHRYHAALMRSRMEPHPSRDYRRAVAAVVDGRDAYLRALRAGIMAEELHAVYLEVLDRHGVRHWNRHGSGYSLGIAFPPNWGELAHLALITGVATRLEAGMVLHVSSGLTAPEAGVPHIALSECVLLTETGCERLIELGDFL